MKIGLALHLALRREDNPGEVEAAKDFKEEQADRAPVEIGERVDRQESAFCEGEAFQGEVAQTCRGIGPAGGEVGPVIPHQHGNFMRQWGFKIADPDRDCSPPSGPIRNKVGADESVKLREEALVEIEAFKIPSVDTGFDSQHPLSQNRGYLRIGEGAKGCFDESGSPIWLSISCRRPSSTGSLSNAMLWATS